MRIRFVSIVVWLVLILSPVAIPADEREASSSRWGITTKKNLEQSSIPEVTGETESNPEGTQAIAPAPPADQTASSPSTNAEGNVKIEPTQQPSPDKPTPTPKGHTTAAPRKGNPPHAIDWSSEGQKKACDGYLKDLRSLFLKTRHYSIQGASCDTAESAAAFLDSMEKCQRNCPEGLLENSGYSDRIIRNIRYLEKLGNDRCSGSLTPTTKK